MSFKFVKVRVKKTIIMTCYALYWLQIYVKPICSLGLRIGFLVIHVILIVHVKHAAYAYIYMYFVYTLFVGN